MSFRWQLSVFKDTVSPNFGTSHFRKIAKRLFEKCAVLGKWRKMGELLRVSRGLWYNEGNSVRRVQYGLKFWNCQHEIPRVGTGAHCFCYRQFPGWNCAMTLIFFGGGIAQFWSMYPCT